MTRINGNGSSSCGGLGNIPEDKEHITTSTSIATKKVGSTRRSRHNTRNEDTGGAAKVIGVVLTLLILSWVGLLVYLGRLYMDHMNATTQPQNSGGRVDVKPSVPPPSPLPSPGGRDWEFSNMIPIPTADKVVQNEKAMNDNPAIIKAEDYTKTTHLEYTPREMEEKIMIKEGWLDDTLKDDHNRCWIWADLGYCTLEKEYMLKKCQRSCQSASVCIPDLWNPVNPSDEEEEENDDDESPPPPQKQYKEYTFTDLAHGQDMGQYQVLSLKQYEHIQILELIKDIDQARQYMLTAEVNPEVKKQCRNTYPFCTIWAHEGHCSDTPTFMKKECAPACHSCDYLSLDESGRCPVDYSPEAQVWKPGDMGAMFTKLTSEPYLSKYNVQILSSPAGKIKPTYYNEYDKSPGPWVITLDNIISEKECETLIELGEIQGYESSYEVGAVKADGTYDKSYNQHRTSTNTWCAADCYQNTTVQTILQRLEEITGIPEPNSEFLQLLKYHPEQFYNVHHGTYKKSLRPP